MDFVVQSRHMETNWAADNLQTIRTLMERSAIYRRALAPILLFAGVLGVVAAVAGWVFKLNSIRAFGSLWLGTAGVAVAGAFLIARRQSLKDHEPFWSPPTRRVAQALLPALAAGLFLGLLITLTNSGDEYALFLVLIWTLFYGCALHAAGFFTPRGMKLFGWLYIGGACGFFGFLAALHFGSNPNANLVMGIFFGVPHLAYGTYLYLTEKRGNES